MIKNFKKNQVIIFVIALMLVTAGYLNFTTNQQQQNLVPTSTLADSETMASIGDATLVSANEAKTETQNTNQNINSNVNQNTVQNEINNTTSSNTNNSQSQSNENNEGELQSNKATAATEAKDDNYFAQSRLDRDTMYSQMFANYQTILESENIAADEKKIAQEEIKRINNEKNAIMIAENLIKTKGFEDVVLFINNGSVSAIIKAETLEKDQVAQLQNIITRELSVEANKINISSKK